LKREQITPLAVESCVVKVRPTSFADVKKLIKFISLAPANFCKEEYSSHKKIYFEKLSESLFYQTKTVLAGSLEEA